MATRIETILSDERAKKLTREATFDRASIDAKERTVELSFASEACVERWYGREILDMQPESCDMTRMNGGAAFLLNHDWNRQIGAVVKAWIDPTMKKSIRAMLVITGVKSKQIFGPSAKSREEKEFGIDFVS